VIEIKIIAGGKGHRRQLKSIRRWQGIAKCRRKAEFHVSGRIEPEFFLANGTIEHD
jgi:hypothetical protein